MTGVSMNPSNTVLSSWWTARPLSLSRLTALLVDDFVISGGTLVQAAIALKELGANSVYAAVTHGVFADQTIEALDDSPIELLFVTNTVEPLAEVLSPKVEVVSVGPLLFGEAIRRIDQRESISVLFN
jgi:ribose-phosphate pyrophosphokinase